MDVHVSTWNTNNTHPSFNVRVLLTKLGGEKKVAQGLASCHGGVMHVCVLVHRCVQATLETPFVASCGEFVWSKRVQGGGEAASITLGPQNY